MSQVKKSNLKGFYMCSLTYSFERMAFYASRWLMVTYVGTELAKGGLGLGKATGGNMQAYLTAFTYAAPVLMAFIADRLIGSKYLIPLGLVFMSSGYLVGGFFGTYPSLWLMIALVSIGTGLFKANLASLSGTLFATPGEKEASYSTQYSFINIGALIGTLTIGVIAAKFGFMASFKLTGIICLIGTIWFVFGWRVLGDAGSKPFKATNSEKKEEKNTSTRPLAPYEVRRMVSILIVTIFSIIFWTFWYLTYLVVYDYLEKYVNLQYGSFTIPTSWADSSNSLFCIALGPVLGMLWLKLSKRPQGDMSLYKKVGLGMFLLASSFGILLVAEAIRGIGSPETNKVSIAWVVLIIFLMSLGEMFFSPLGNSFVAKYAPKKYLSTMMGFWVLGVFVASFIYGAVYGVTLKMNFMTAYSIITGILVVSALLIILFEKKLASLVQLKPGEKLLED